MTRFLTLALCTVLPQLIFTQIINFVEISGGVTNFPEEFARYDYFSDDTVNFGDFDGDGIEDLLVTAPSYEHPDLPDYLGGIWLLLLDEDRDVKQSFRLHEQLREISPVSFSWSFIQRETIEVAGIGDLNNDGVRDMAVLFNNYESASENPSGAIVLTYLDSEAEIIDYDIIENGPVANATPGRFGVDLANVGDINGDGFADLAASFQINDGIAGNESSRDNQLQLYFLNPDPDQISIQRIVNEFAGGTWGEWGFGYSIAAAGDINKDGTPDLAVGCPHCQLDEAAGVGYNGGSISLLFMSPEGEVIGHQNINTAQGNFSGELDSGDPHFGESIVSLGDLDQDNSTYLAVGGSWDNLQGNVHLGTLWMLKLTNSGQVGAHYVISALEGNFPFIDAQEHDHIFEHLAVLNDIDGDGNPEIVAGTNRFNDRGSLIICNGNWGELSTAVDNRGEATELLIYPNPTDASLRIEANNTIQSLVLFNFFGQQLGVYPGSVDKDMDLDTSILPNGAYWLEVILVDGTLIGRKFLVQR
ncbi:MAG: T9SS type A sorting domain-containing protein [Bacteroidota bacterium]